METVWRGNRGRMHGRSRRRPSPPGCVPSSSSPVAPGGWPSLPPQPAALPTAAPGHTPPCCLPWGPGVCPPPRGLGGWGGAAAAATFRWAGSCASRSAACLARSRKPPKTTLRSGSTAMAPRRPRNSGGRKPKTPPISSACSAGGGGGGGEELNKGFDKAQPQCISLLRQQEGETASLFPALSGPIPFRPILPLHLPM